MRNTVVLVFRSDATLENMEADMVLVPSMYDNS